MTARRNTPVPHNTDRILTTHVGSLIRPPPIFLAAILPFEGGVMSKRRSADSSRRNFLKSAGLAGAAAAMVPPATANLVPAAPQTRKAAIPGPRQVAAETLA